MTEYLYPLVAVWRREQVDDNLAVREAPDGGPALCVHCGTWVGPLAGGAFVASPARRDAPPTEAGPHIWHDPLEYVDAEVVFRWMFVPGRLTAVHSRIVPVGHPLSADEYRGWGVSRQDDRTAGSGRCRFPGDRLRRQATRSAAASRGPRRREPRAATGRLCSGEGAVDADCESRGLPEIGRCAEEV